MKAFSDRMLKIQNNYMKDADKYVARSLNQMKDMQQKTGAMFDAFYKQVSLGQKKLSLQQEADRQRQIQVQLDALRSLAKEGSDQQKELDALIAQSQQRQADAVSKSIKMERALADERYKNLGPIQKANQLIADQQEKSKQLKELESQRQASLAAAETDEERAQIQQQYDEEVGRLNKTSPSIMSSKLGEAIGKLADMPAWAKAIIEGLQAVTSAVNTAASDSVRQTVSVYSQYMGKIDARLQGSDNNFNKITKLIQQNVGVSAYVNQKQLIDQIARFTNEGIAYNLEERAYLQTLSDRMVTTFDALDASLTRIIRLQQSDITAAALGSEATLTQLLNSVFQDTSYLNSLYDSVYEAIIDASSQFNTEDQTQYAYNVQKWLGALYSTGMSSTAIQMLAQGLNMLTTGNVSALNQNTSLQTLFGLAAQRSGMSYSSILTQGLGAEGVNTLMKSIVELLQDISNNTSNQVTKSAWGDILNMSLSDFRAVSNLTNTDITSIFTSGITLQSALAETNYQLQQVVDRTHMQERIDNTIENIMINWASDLVSDQERYKTWKIWDFTTDFIKQTTSDSAIGKLVSGVTDIIKLINNLSSLGLPDLSKFDLDNATALGLDVFDWDQYTSRGSLASTIAGYGNLTGVASGLSYSGQVIKGISDTQMETLQDVAANTTFRAVTSDATATLLRDVNDIYAELFEAKTPIRVIVSSVEQTAKDDIYDSVDVKGIRKDNSDIKEAITMQSSAAIAGATAGALNYVRDSF